MNNNEVRYRSNISISCTWEGENRWHPLLNSITTSDNSNDWIRSTLKAVYQILLEAYNASDSKEEIGDIVQLMTLIEKNYEIEV